MIHNIIYNNSDNNYDDVIEFFVNFPSKKNIFYFVKFKEIINFA